MLRMPGSTRHSVIGKTTKAQIKRPGGEIDGSHICILPTNDINCIQERRLTMPRVIHFEIPADEPETATGFYEEVFEWKIAKWDGPVEYWLVTTGEDDQPGINGGITRRQNQDTTCLTIDVPSVDEFAQKIVEAGGKVVVPKMPVPGVGYAAYCADTEGNVFGIMEGDPWAQ